MKNELRWVSGAETPDKVWITRVWNLGTWEEWNEMKEQYSREDILDAVEHPIRGVWTKRGKRFAEVVSGTQMPDDVLCEYHV